MNLTVFQDLPVTYFQHVDILCGKTPEVVLKLRSSV